MSGAWELAQGFASIIADNAAGLLFARGKIDRSQGAIARFPHRRSGEQDRHLTWARCWPGARGSFYVAIPFSTMIENEKGLDI